LLGGSRVAVGARTIEESAWRLRKATSQVKLLALARGHHLHRERVMDFLRPELVVKAASNNLRQTLHAVCRTLRLDLPTGPRYLRLRVYCWSCAGGQLWVDVEGFECAATARCSRPQIWLEDTLEAEGEDPI
jgi:DNA-binding SARP family transcriptional activator